MKTTNDLCAVRDSETSPIHAASCGARIAATDGSLVVSARRNLECIVSMHTAGDRNNSPLIVS